MVFKVIETVACWRVNSLLESSCASPWTDWRWMLKYLGIFLPQGRPLRLGLSAVVEDVDGILSYWALRHPSGKPDFHHTDAFALQLDKL